MSDLKPCPFCGGEAQTTLRNIGDSGEDFWSVECFDPECGCDFCLYHTEAEAIEAWNTRAELAITTALERETCKNKAPRYLDFLCSECGFVHYIDDSNCTGDDNEWNYCPNCGARVVD